MLRTYEGHLYPDFQSACLARGLLASDEEWDICLTEAGLIQSGHQLRQLFVTILLGNSPANPRKLFDTHRHNLSDDCRFHLQRYFHLPYPSDDQITTLALQYIDTLLQKAGKTLTDYSLPKPLFTFDDFNGVSRILAEEISYDIDILNQRWQQDYPKANLQQKHVLDAVTAKVDANEGGLFFIDGPAGTGKTFVENLILAYVRGHHKIALAVASSGIASILLEGGRTSHSRFKIPLDVVHDSVCDIKAQSALAELIRRTDLIIWDEAPAQHRYCFEAMDRTLRDIRKCDQWFGGVIMVFAGILPLSF